MAETEPLRVLLLEDSPADARRILEELAGHGYDVRSEQVATPDAMEDALGRAPWDVVISDFEMTTLDSSTALDIMKHMGQDLPFLIVADSEDEESAVAAALKSGADDFVTRGHLGRLATAVKRELRDVRTRRDRILACAALRQSEAQYRALVERSAFGIFRATGDGALVAVNPALVSILRYQSADDLLAINLREIFEDEAARDGLMARLIDHDRIAGEEAIWRPLSGSPIRVRLSGSVVERQDSGSFVFNVMVEDVTERFRLQEQLRQSQKMESIGHLAGGMAHDFNNLLTTILGYSELLCEQIGPDVPIGSDLRQIMRAAERASALTRQLLAFSRRQILTLAPLDLNHTVDNLGTMMRRLLGERIALKTTLSEQLGPVMGDAVQLEQVLINLVVNARDAMPTGGTLTIQTGTADLDADAAAALAGLTPGPHSVVSVSDTGTGMSPDVQQRIFEPFFTTKEHGRGTGLGLAAVHGLIGQLGGCVRVESEPGRGTTFHIYLPVCSQQAPVEAGGGAVMSAAGNETILLVEDEDSVRAFVKTVLERFGYRVLGARDAESALTLLSTFNGRLDLLLTDVILPNMDGTDLARHVARRRPETPVLFMSGYPQGMASAEGCLQPGVELLEKPFTANAVLSRVRQTMGKDAAALRA